MVKAGTAGRPSRSLIKKESGISAEDPSTKVPVERKDAIKLRTSTINSEESGQDLKDEQETSRSRKRTESILVKINKLNEQAKNGANQETSGDVEEGAHRSGQTMYSKENKGTTTESLPS